MRNSTSLKLQRLADTFQSREEICSQLLDGRSKYRYFACFLDACNSSIATRYALENGEHSLVSNVQHNLYTNPGSVKVITSKLAVIEQRKCKPLGARPNTKQQVVEDFTLENVVEGTLLTNLLDRGEVDEVNKEIEAQTKQSMTSIVERLVSNKLDQFYFTVAVTPEAGKMKYVVDVLKEVTANQKTVNIDEKQCFALAIALFLQDEAITEEQQQDVLDSLKNLEETVATSDLANE